MMVLSLSIVLNDFGHLWGIVQVLRVGTRPFAYLILKKTSMVVITNTAAIAIANSHL